MEKIETLIPHGELPDDKHCPGCWVICYQAPERGSAIAHPGWLYAECNECGEQRRVALLPPQHYRLR